MRNPENGSEYILAFNKDTLFITVTRSKQGVVRAWHGYSDTVLATAGGYGYDKESSVLAHACAKFIENTDINNGAGVGVERVKTLVAKAGGRLYDRQDMIGFVYDDIKVNNY
jgi:hypothetical protein